MDERRNLKRRVTDEQMERRIGALEDRMHDVETGIRRLAVGVEKNNTQTQEMYEVFADAKGGFRTLALIGKGAKPVFLIFAVASAILVGIKTGVWNWPR